MDILVEFTGEVGARIIKDPRVIAQKMNGNNVLLNPDIKHLAGISPSFWVKNGDQIDAISPELAHKMVFESEDEKGSLTPQKLVSFEAKLKEVKAEIDAKRDEDIHNMLKALKHQKLEMGADISDLRAELKPMIEEAISDLKNRQRKIELLSFLYLIAMILIKFV